MMQTSSDQNQWTILSHLFKQRLLVRDLTASPWKHASVVFTRTGEHMDEMVGCNTGIRRHGWGIPNTRTLIGDHWAKVDDT